MKHIIDTDELEKLPKYAWSDVSAVPCNRGDYVHIDDFRKLIANSPQADGMVLALKNTELKKRIAVLEDLLSSAYNIANRNGEHTHWQRFAGQLHVNGISPITAKTFKILPSDTMLSNSPQADDVRKDAERLDWIEKKFCGLSDSERYLPFRLSWGKGNNKTLREAIDKAKEKI